MNMPARVKGWLGLEVMEPGARISQAVASLVARGVVEGYRELPEGNGVILQWTRGNFGHRLEARGREVYATPVAPAAGPFGDGTPVSQVPPLQQWLPVGADTSIAVLRRASHMQLAEAVRKQGLEHPCVSWFRGRIEALAEGRRLSGDELAGMVLLGARKFLKTIPNTDRLQEKLPATASTLADMAGKERRAMETDEESVTIASVTAGSGAMAILEFLNESFPLEARKAIRKLTRN